MMFIYTVQIVYYMIP